MYIQCSYTILINFTYFINMYVMFMFTYVTGFVKTDLIVTFSILKNTDLKYRMDCGSLMVQYSPTKLTVQEA